MGLVNSISRADREGRTQTRSLIELAERLTKSTHRHRALSQLTQACNKFTLSQTWKYFGRLIKYWQVLQNFFQFLRLDLVYLGLKNPDKQSLKIVFVRVLLSVTLKRGEFRFSDGTCYFCSTLLWRGFRKEYKKFRGQSLNSKLCLFCKLDFSLMVQRK